MKILCRNDEQGNPIEGNEGYCPDYCNRPFFGGKT